MAANHSGPIFLALSVLVSAPLPARAQPAPLVAIATDIGVVAPANSGINAGVQLSAQVRIPARGWAAIGVVARFETETEFLELTVTRLAGGAAYTRSAGRLVVSPAFAAGYAFNGAAVKGSTQQVTLTNCVTSEAQVALLWHANRRVGIGGVASYLFARPTLDFGNRRGSPSERLKLDGFVAALRLELALGDR